MYCNVCHKVFASSYGLKSHKTTHRETNNPTVPIRENNIIDDKELKEVLSTRTSVQHWDASEGVPRRGLCKKDEANSFNIKEYKRDFNCAKCDDKFPTEKLMVLHNCPKSAHLPHKFTNDSKPISLYNTGPQNQSSIGNRAGNEVFISHTHSNSTGSESNAHADFTCDKCAKVFKSVHDFDQHEKTHKGNNIKCDWCGAIFSETRYLEHLKVHIHKCDDCGVVCATRYSLKQHQQSHYHDKPYVCDTCGKKFKSAGSVKYHKQTVHAKDRHAFKCDMCEKAYSTKYKLKYHKKSHMCDVCGMVYSDMASLRYHKNTHLGEKPFKCDVCDKEFVAMSGLQKHKKKHTKAIRAGEKPFKCVVCDKTYITECQLNDHEKSHTEDSYKCDVCDKVCDTLAAFKEHKMTHENFKPKCGLCNKFFSRLTALKYHQVFTHGIDNTHKCVVCEEAFISQHELKNHEKIHTEESYKCKDCGEVCRLLAAFKIHRQTCLGDKPFKCNDCDFEFATVISLKEHMTIHPLEKPYKCKLCDKTFAQGYTLKCHERAHTGERPYKCDMCKKTYVQKSALTWHKRRHKSGELLKCDICDKKYAKFDSLNRHKKTHRNLPKCDVDVLS